MLVLTRYPNEEVIIRVPPSDTPQEIKLVVVKIDGIKARLGFQADRSINIARLEIDTKKATESPPNAIHTPLKQSP